MIEELKYQTYDNTGINLLMDYFMKAPQRKATWDEALQFLNLLYSISFAEAVYVADFEKIEDYVIVQRWFERFQDNWTSNWGADPFFRRLHVVDKIDEMARIAADEMLSEIRNYMTSVSIAKVKNPNAKFVQSNLTSKEYKDTKLGPPGAFARDDEVDRIIKGDRPREAHEYIKKQEGIVPLMFILQPDLLNEIRRLRDFGWSPERSYYIAIRSRMIANSTYCRCVEDDIAAHVPASSRTKNVVDTTERFSQIIGKYIWNELDEKAKQSLKNDISMTNMILTETQITLGRMAQYILPIQIALDTVNSKTKTTMRKQIVTMIDKAKEFASNNPKIVKDGRKYDYLLLKTKRNIREYKKIERILKTYSIKEDIPEPLHIGFGIDQNPWGISILLFKTDLHEIIKNISQYIEPVLSRRSWSKRKLLRELVIKRRIGKQENKLREALGVDSAAPPLKNFQA